MWVDIGVLIHLFIHEIVCDIHYYTRTLGDRAFVAAAPTLWNSLPVKTRLVDSTDTFKKQAKTHLFPSSHK